MRSNEQIGGPGEIVEIDESMLSKRKYNRKRSLNQVWVFGGIVRGKPLECFIEVVESRNRPVLLDVINRRSKPGSTISSDSWRAYSNLTELLPEKDFEEHKVVNHSENLINPEDQEDHTQNIEAFWSSFKRNLRNTNLKDCQEILRTILDNKCFVGYII